MNMIFTNIPRRGDICLGRLSDNKVLFARLDSITALSDISSSTYEINGVVADVRDGEALVVYKQNTSKKWAERYYFKLTGYTLDGAEHSGVISVRQASDSWAANHDYTFTYSASTLTDFVSQLNTWFASTAPFDTQDWYAEEGDGFVNMNFQFTDYRQVGNNTGKSGFTMTANLLPEYAFLANIRRKNGFTGGEGAISNMYRALTYFRNDNSSTTYNPNADVTNVKRSYPICLPAYLGTSQYQSDHCASLRSVYGAGEAGWKKFMESCLPVVPTDWGNMGMRDGLARTSYLAAQTYNSRTVTGGVLCPAAKYCYDTATATLPLGNWHLPTTDEVYRVLDGIKYNSEGNDRDLDILNKALNLIGGTAISNGSYVWSCLRGSAYGAWYAYGFTGFFSNYSMYGSSLSVPVSLYKLTE